MAEKNVLSALNKFNSNIIKRQLMPLDSSLSLPIPILINDKVNLGFLCFISKRLGKEKKIKIYRPNSCFAIAIKSSRIVYYMNYGFKDQFPQYNWNHPIGEFPHYEIEKLNIKEYTENRRELLIKYDLILDLFTSNTRNDSEIKLFSELFYYLCEPSLLPFMKKIGNKFFSWMDDELP